MENGRPIWRRLEFASVTAVAVTLLFVVIGQSAEQLATTLAGDLTPGPVKTQFNAIDYSTTGAVGKGPVVIGPCATRQP